MANSPSILEEERLRAMAQKPGLPSGIRERAGGSRARGECLEAEASKSEVTVRLRGQTQAEGEKESGKSLK